MGDEDDLLLLAATAAVATNIIAVAASIELTSDMRAGRTHRGSITATREDRGAFYTKVPLLILDAEG